MSIKFPPAILGPEMAAPVLRAPGIFGFFLLENPHPHKIPPFRGVMFSLEGGGVEVPILFLWAQPPGIEWKTGRNPKMGKNWPKNRKWPSARNGEKMAQKWRKNGIWGHFSIFSPFLGHFFPISGRGPFSIFWPIFSHFWISARFPFYTRRPDWGLQTLPNSHLPARDRGPNAHPKSRNATT